MHNRTSGPSKAHFTLQIPVIDHGALEYRGERCEQLINRLIDLCYYVCFLAWEMALSVEMDSEAGAYNLCLRMKTTVEQRLPASFVQELRIVKEAYMSEEAKSRVSYRAIR